MAAPIIQVDPVTARIACPLCSEVTEFEVTLAPVMHNVGGQLGLGFQVVGMDDSAVWEHVTTAHADVYRRDFPGGAKRGLV